MRELWVARLGVVPYREGMAFQEALRERRLAGEVPDTLLLLEHPPVYTRGRRSTDGELSFAPEWYARQGIDVVEVPRGGLVTYHGPGQLVGYPIVRIDGTMAYVHALEEALVAALADEGIAARNRPEEGPSHMGVWVQERKLASVGVHVRQHVATHGFAANVDNDMRPWEWIVACGLPGVTMTSLADELGETALTRPPASVPFETERPPSTAVERFAERVVARFGEAFGATPVAVDPADLGVPMPWAAGRATAGAVSSGDR